MARIYKAEQKSLPGDAGNEVKLEDDIVVRALKVNQLQLPVKQYSFNDPVKYVPVAGACGRTIRLDQSDREYKLCWERECEFNLTPGVPSAQSMTGALRTLPNTTSTICAGGVRFRAEKAVITTNRCGGLLCD